MTDRCKGALFRTTKRSRLRSGRYIPPKQLLLALEEPIDGWMPVLFRGQGEYVRREFVKPIPTKRSTSKARRR